MEKDHTALPQMDEYLAGFIQPPVWFGELPKLTQREKLLGKPLDDYIERIYDDEICGRRVIVESDGYIGISLDVSYNNTITKKKLFSTIKKLNCILGNFILEGFPVKSVQSSNFTSTYYIPTVNTLSLAFRTHTKSEELVKKREEPVDLNQFQKERRFLSKSMVNSILNQAKKLLENNEIYEALNLLTHSMSHIYQLESNQAFILGWTIIEQYLNYKWEQLLKGKRISNKRIDKLKSRDYTVSVVCEILNLMGEQSDDEYAKFNKLRRARNDFMHELKPISSQLAHKAVSTARDLLKQRCVEFSS